MKAGAPCRGLRRRRRWRPWWASTSALGDGEAEAEATGSRRVMERSALFEGVEDFRWRRWGSMPMPVSATERTNCSALDGGIERGCSLPVRMVTSPLSGVGDGVFDEVSSRPAGGVQGRR